MLPKGTEISKLSKKCYDTKLVVAGVTGEVSEVQHINGVITETHKLHTEEVVFLSHSEEYGVLLSVSIDGCFKLTKGYQETLKSMSNLQETAICHASCSWSQGVFVTAGVDSKVVIWNFLNCSPEGCIQFLGEIVALCLGEEFPLLGVCDSKGRVSVFSTLDTKKPLWCLVVQEVPLVLSFYSYKSTSEHDTTALSKPLTDNCELYVGADNGYIYVWDLSKLLVNLKSTKNNLNYFMYKKANVNCRVYKEFIKLNLVKCQTPQVTNAAPKAKWNSEIDTVKDLKVHKVTEKLVFVLGAHGTLKIWNCEGKCRAQLNLRENFPDYWELKVNTFEYRYNLYKKAECLLTKLKAFKDPLSPPKSTDRLVDSSSLLDISYSVPKQPKPQLKVSQSGLSLRQIEARKKDSHFNKKLVFPNLGDFTFKNFVKLENIKTPQSTKRSTPANNFSVQKRSSSVLNLKKRNYQIRNYTPLKPTQRASVKFKFHK